MNTPTPVPSPGWTPTNSTLASGGLGTAAAAVIGYVLDTYTPHQVPMPVLVAMGSIISAAIGYFFEGGRK